MGGYPNQYRAYGGNNGNMNGGNGGMNGGNNGGMNGGNGGMYPYPVTCPYGTKKYMIMPGDTLYSLAVKYNTTVDEILYYNPQITNPNMIYAGEYLCIPYPMTCDGFMYTIKPGDTLYTIAMSFSITVDELLAANPHIDPNYYQAGEMICIPQGYPCKGDNTLYVVQPNDTLTNILTECNVSLNALLSANPTFDPNNIVPGTKLCVIPTPCEPMCDAQYICKVPSNVTSLEELAKVIGKTTDEILYKNPNYPPCYFTAGHPYCKP